MNKVKEFFQNIKIDGVVSFCKKNIRYIGAGAAFIALILILAFGTGAMSGRNKLAGAYQDFSENKNEEIDALIKNYFKSYAAGDVDTLKTIATPISDAEVSYIQFYSQYIEKYQKIKIYTKRGLDKDSYLCSVYLQVKFQDIETPAAGLDFFYIEKNDDGKYFINNIYGSFNQANGEFDMDSDIAALIAAFEQQQDVLSLQANVQKECNEAMLADENLNTFINTTLQQNIAQWASQYKAAVAQAAQEAAAKKAEEEAAAKKAEEEAKAAEEAAAKEKEEKANAKEKIAKAKINVRDAAGENGNKVGQLAEGEKVTVYAVENGWAKIAYGGSTAYVKDEFLEPVEKQNNADNAQSTGGSLKGKTITLSNTVNVRESMNENASRVAVAYAGEQISIVEEYAEGWSKVTYNGKSGYCKTEFLK